MTGPGRLLGPYFLQRSATYLLAVAAAGPREGPVSGPGRILCVEKRLEEGTYAVPLGDGWT